MNNRMKQLIEQINQHDHSYYVLDKPTISDKQYDTLYDELLKLEAETGIIMSNSPTQRVSGEVLDKLTKVKHTTPMLSCQKTKSIDEVIKFANNREMLMSWKLDGCTCVLRYSNGKFQQAISRGSGTEGEDCTHNIKKFLNVPMTISYKGNLEVRGECVISWDNFNKINSTLSEDEKYSHPRNLASASMRLLDSNIAEDRYLEFVAFDVTEYDNDTDILTKSGWFGFLHDLGFEVVDHCVLTHSIDKEIEYRSGLIKSYKYAVDGIIIRFNYIAYAESLGATGHHKKDSIAFKLSDETVESKFLGVELKTSRNGIVSITGLFEPVEIDGSIVSRASLHNVDIFESLELGLNDAVTLYKANQIIPQVFENLSRTNTYKLPNICPSCSNALKTICPTNTRVLYCDNENCKSRLLQKFVHFCSKDAMNIDGLSESTLEKFLDNGWIEKFADLYHLEDYATEIVNTDGFGTRSYEKLQAAIENSKNTTIARYLVACGIPNIGRTASKVIGKACGNSINTLLSFEREYVEILPDFGEIMCKSFMDWLYSSPYIEQDLLENLVFVDDEPIQITTNSVFTDKSICITGSFDMGSRDEIQKKIEALGGRFVSSVSKKTDILLAGSACGSKLQKAKECNVRIIEESELIKILEG